MGALQVILTAVNRSFILLELLLKFGNLQNRQELSLLYVSSPIHIKLLDVPRDLGIDLDLLVRLKFRSNFHVVCEVPSRDPHDGGSGSLLVGVDLICFPATGTKTGENEQSKES